MNVTYEHRPAMTFIGFSASIRPEEGYGRRFGGRKQEKISEVME